jgi:hypothetical protein
VAAAIVFARSGGASGGTRAVWSRSLAEKKQIIRKSGLLEYYEHR